MSDRSAPGSESSSNALDAPRPTRGADRNRATLGAGADRSGTGFLLPALDDGITLLDVAEGRGVPILQSLVLDHLLLNDGPAVWIDARGHATTTTLARLAPGRRLLDRIHVVRGFTPYQHFAAVRDLPTARGGAVGDADAPGGASGTRRAGTGSAPSLVVCPALDARYRDDALRDADARTLQARVLARLRAYARGGGVPVLVTRTTADRFAAPIEAAADRRLRCERTGMGPRIVGDDFETRGYPVDGGACYQTTFAYWRDLLDARARQVGHEPASPPSPATAADDVGGAATVGGTSATATASPLLDAWTGAAGTGGR